MINFTWWVKRSVIEKERKREKERVREQFEESNAEEVDEFAINSKNYLHRKPAY